MKINKLIAGTAIILLVALAFRGELTGLVTSAACGNAVCELGENKASCPEDCKSICRNNLCEELEDKTCPQDCTASAKDGEKIKAFSGINLLALAIISLALLVSVLPFIAKYKQRKKKSKRK